MKLGKTQAFPDLGKKRGLGEKLRNGSQDSFSARGPEILKLSVAGLLLAIVAYNLPVSVKAFLNNNFALVLVVFTLGTVALAILMVFRSKIRSLITRFLEKWLS